MTDVYRNPEEQPADEHVEIRYTDPADWSGTRMNTAGPGGRTNNLEHNEKGILEQGLFDAMSTYHKADLSADHNSQRQGIYKQDSGKYGD